MPHRLFSLSLFAICTFLFLVGCEDSKERAERHYQSALELLEDGDVERALVELRNVIKFDVEHKDGRLLYAQTLEEKGEFQEAISQYLRVVEQDPDRLEAHIPLTRMSLELNAWEEALRHGRAARELAPENEDVIFLNAVLDYQEAIQAGDMLALDAPLNTAKTKLDKDSSDQLAWRLVVDHAVTRGDTELALKNIEIALSHLPGEFNFHAIRLQLLMSREDMATIGLALQDMVERFPDDLQAHNMLLAWYFEQDDMAGAEAFLRKLATAPEAGPIENLRVVDFLRRTQNSESARAELDRLIAEASTDNTYLATRAALDFEEGHTDTAIATMKDMLESAEASEETANLKVNLARMLVSTGSIDEAKTLVDEILAGTEGHVEALKMRATWEIEDDRPEDAILTLRTAQAGAPRDPDIMTLMGQAHERAGARELAGERYSLAVEASGRAPKESLRYADFLSQDNRLDVAEAVLTDALKVTPTNINLLMAMADIQLRQQNWDQVTRFVWQLRAQGTLEATAAADQIEAALLLRQHRSEDAIAFLGELSSADESNITALANLISTLVREDKVDTARAMLDERLKQDTQNPDLRFLRAGIHVVEGESDQAEEVYRGLLEEFPEDPRSLRQLNQILTQQAREDDLAALLTAVIDVHPTIVLPKFLRAEQLERLQDFDGAISLYEALYAENSSNQIIANNLASLITTHRNDEESLSRAYTVARRLRGSEIPAFQDTYGWIAFRRGNHSEALDYLKQAAAGLPNNPLVHYHLGETYIALGQTQNAREALTRASELFENQELSQFNRTQELLNSLSSDN
ncbi:MAG: tetratricopeptide repeat protein [Pseudomonadota bacterium]